MNKFSKINLFKLAAAFTCIFIILFSVFTIIKASSYSVLADDDFWHGYDVGVFHTGFMSYFIASLRYTKHMYLTWQGTYFSMFLQAFLSPMNNYGMPQLRAVMIFNSLNFFVSLIVFIYTLLNRLSQKQWLPKLAICTCIVFTITSYSAFQEVFYWFSGATSYTFPISFLFYSLTAVLLLNSTTNSKKKYTLIIWSVFSGVLAMGGSLTVAAAGCYFMLLLTVYEWISSKKLPYIKLVIFICYFSGALINAIAPGNFLRQQTSEGDGLQLFASLKNSFLVYESNFRWLFHSTNFSLILLLILLCGVFLYKNISVKNITGYTFVSIAGIIAPFVVIFPAVLGYNVPWIPNRCVFVVIVVMSVAFSNLTLILSYHIMRTITDSNRSLIVIVILMLAFVTASANSYTLADCMTRKLHDELIDGTIPNYYSSYMDMIHLFEASEGADLRLDPAQVPAAIDNFYYFTLSADPDNRTNNAISYFYHLNSVSQTGE